MNPKEIKFFARSPSNSILGRPTFLHGEHSSKESELEERFVGLLLTFGVIGFGCLIRDRLFVVLLSFVANETILNKKRRPLSVLEHQWEDTEKGQSLV